MALFLHLWMQWNSNIFVHKVRSSSTKLQTHDKSHCGHLTNMFGLSWKMCLQHSYPQNSWHSPLFRNERFMLNEMFQQNTSKLIITFWEYGNRERISYSKIKQSLKSFTRTRTFNQAKTTYLFLKSDLAWSDNFSW